VLLRLAAIPHLRFPPLLVENATRLPPDWALRVAPAEVSVSDARSNACRASPLHGFRLNFFQAARRPLFIRLNREWRTQMRKVLGIAILAGALGSVSAMAQSTPDQTKPQQPRPKTTSPKTTGQKPAGQKTAGTTGTLAPADHNFVHEAAN